MSMQISLIFSQASKKRLQLNFLYPEKLQSPLAKDTDRGKDFILRFLVFFRPFSGLKGKLSAGQSIYNWELLELLVTTTC